jgi:hypothetical protein
MIGTLWDNAGWIWALLPFASYLVKFSRFAGLLGFLGPFAEVARVFLEGLAGVLTFLLKCAWHCLFNPLTWGPIVLVYFAGSFYPVQNIEVKTKFHKRAAIVQPVSQKKAPKRRNDAGSEMRRNFMR